MPKLNTTEKILFYMSIGLNQTQIAKKLRFTRQNISYYVNKYNLNNGLCADGKTALPPRKTRK